MDLSLKMGNQTFANPIWTASGTFGYGLEFAEVMDISRLGALVTKGLSLQPRDGNPPPRICETAAGMLNSIGLENVGLEAFLSDKLPPLRGLGATVVANVYGNVEDDYVEIARRLETAEGVQGIELNLSCPNVKEGGMAFGVDARAAASVTERVRMVFTRALLVKMSPNVTDATAIARAIESAGADGISAINTLVGMAIDPRTGRFRLSAKTGGLSGPAIKPVAVRIVYQIARAVKIPIIGIGGIMNVWDAIEFFRAGASAVQVGTASFTRADVAMEILNELPRRLEELGATSVGALRVE